MDERENLPSASGAAILYNCPASPRLQALAPKEEKPAPWAEEGSLIHEAMETEDGSELNLTQAEITERLTRLKESSLKRWREEFPIQDKGFEFKEERLWITDDNGKKIASAKPDWGMVIGDHAILGDWKSGWNQVENAAASLQGRFQAVALHCQNPELVHVRIFFAQARLSTFYTECDYNLSDLIHAKREIEYALWKSERPDAIAVPGKWCQYCRAKPYCKAAAAYSLLPSAFVNNGSMLTAKERTALIPSLVDQMSLEDLRDIHERNGIIYDVLDAIKARLKRLPEETLKELGYEKRPGVKYITKTDINPLFQLLWDQGIWDHIKESERLKEATKQFSECTTALTGEVNKLVIPVLIGRKGYKTKKAAEEKVKELLAQVSTFGLKESTLKKLKE